MTLQFDDVTLKTIYMALLTLGARTQCPSTVLAIKRFSRYSLIYLSLQKVKIFTKTPTRAPKCILIKSPPIVLSHDVFTHDLNKRVKMKSNRISNVVPFLLAVMVFHQDCRPLTVFLSIKTSYQSISLTPT